MAKNKSVLGTWFPVLSSGGQSKKDLELLVISGKPANKKIEKVIPVKKVIKKVKQEVKEVKKVTKKVTKGK